ncbi:alpha/beta fold hydrolase [Nisaea acidiphila]|uniref:Alpha/beta fold hydrolase n=1 Tax=Nisaea acidiphila TaxID=1862145 RepID=A0A9J7AQQ0_9PROT|nr:alpha/beta fold hydrolase [Nisaea acidiphila]UUX49559.1 alpha/beta fold hydrolase [Nisaea acidiphila]
MATFVLVHGAWHGGWCWRRVADRLRAAGHDVFTPTLTGLADRSHLLTPNVTLQTHVLDIANLLEWEDLNDVVLCGHSYGGMVITGAADRQSERIKSLVYVDAFVPGDGECAMDSRPPERVKLAYEQVRTVGEGWWMPPTPAASFRVNEADQAWVDSKCTNFPIACFTQRLYLTGAADRVASRYYVRAAGYKAPQFDACVERLAGVPGWTVSEMPCGHDIMVDMPEELTALLAEAGC